jgi:putative membrane protein
MTEPGGVEPRTLILCIDGDNDIGKKGGVVTPVISREANINAATALVLADPEEADANAMFGAVRLYDQLSKRYPDEVYEIATVSGAEMGGIEADRNIVKELEKILESFKASGVILVTDGYSDESIIPIIQSRVPITSIQHVVVKHSERIEETWAVIFRYFRMLIEDPYYSRVSLGVPGLMLVILGVLTVFGQLQNAGTVLAFVMGLVLLVKGFGLDERLALARLKLPPIERQLMLATVSVGIIVSLVGVSQGLVNIWTIVEGPAPPPWQDSAWWLERSSKIIAGFILGSINYITMGVAVALTGGIASHYMQRDPKIMQNVVGLIVTFWIWRIAIESANVLIEPEKGLALNSPLVLMIVGGMLTTILSVFVIYGAYKDRLPFKNGDVPS